MVRQGSCGGGGMWGGAGALGRRVVDSGSRSTGTVAFPATLRSESTVQLPRAGQAVADGAAVSPGDLGRSSSGRWVAAWPRRRALATQQRAKE